MQRPSSSHSISFNQGGHSVASSDGSRSASTTPQPTLGTTPIPKDILKFVPRQVQERLRKDRQNPKKTESNVPKASQSTTQFIDRSQQRRDREKALKDLQDQLEAGTISDIQFQERTISIQRGGALPPPIASPNIHRQTTNKDQPQTVDEQLELMEAKEVKPEAPRQQEKVGEVAPAPVPKQKKSRNEILADLKSSRKVGGWKPIGSFESTNNEKVERDVTTEQTQKIWFPDGGIKLNRTLNQDAKRKPKVLGLDVEVPGTDAKTNVNDDIFSDAGEYENPFKLDSDSLSEDESNPPPSKLNVTGKSDFKPGAKINERHGPQPTATGIKSTKSSILSSAADNKDRGDSRGYFRDNPLAGSVYERPNAKQEAEQLKALAATADAKLARDKARGGTTDKHRLDSNDADGGSKRKLKEFQRRDRRDYDDFDDGFESEEEQRGGKRKRRRH